MAWHSIPCPDCDEWFTQPTNGEAVAAWREHFTTVHTPGDS